MTYLNTRAFGVEPAPAFDRCAWEGHAKNEDGECVPCNTCVCDDESECLVHGPGPAIPAGDLMESLKAALCACTSDEFARPACAVLAIAKAEGK